MAQKWGLTHCTLLRRDGRRCCQRPTDREHRDINKKGLNGGTTPSVLIRTFACAGGVQPSSVTRLEGTAHPSGGMPSRLPKYMYQLHWDEGFCSVAFIFFYAV